MRRTAPLALLLIALLTVLARGAGAAPTDLVPRGSTLLDAFATLARAGILPAPAHPSDFLGEPRHTRGELARLLKTVQTTDPDRLARARDMADTHAALITAAAMLRPELKAEGVNGDALVAVSGRTAPATVSGYVQPETRVADHGGSGLVGVYRATALGLPASNLRYAVSVSDWAQDWRRKFYNDVGTHDFPGLSEAYLALDGGRGLTLTLGRFYNNWGPGYRGATMLSDNAPAMNQLQVAFPFSLGARLGHDWRFTQLAATWFHDDTRLYYEARRVEYAFSPHVSADFQEEFQSSRSRSLLVGFLPDFYTGQQTNVKPLNLKLKDLDPYYNAALNAGLSYDAGTVFRVYGQFLVDDIKSPGYSSSGPTPRKIAYLVGTTFRPLARTEIVAEYSFADPTTYSSRNVDTQFQEGRFSEIGLPDGPNSREFFLRVAQRVTPTLTLAVAGRDRRRHDDSFPAPNARTLSAFATLALNPRSSIGVSFYDYRRDAFPLDPSVPVGNGFQPTNAEGNYGQTLRQREMDLSYQFFF